MIKVLSGAGLYTATIRKVESVRGGKVRLDGDTNIEYMTSSGREIAPVMPGFYSFLCHLEEGSEDLINGDKV